MQQKMSPFIRLLSGMFSIAMFVIAYKVKGNTVFSDLLHPSKQVHSLITVAIIFGLCLGFVAIYGKSILKRHNTIIDFNFKTRENVFFVALIAILFVMFLKLEWFYNFVMNDGLKSLKFYLSIVIIIICLLIISYIKIDNLKIVFKKILQSINKKDDINRFIK